MEDVYTPKIKVYHLLEGAQRATGLTVIIDVFRAFSLECYVAAQNPACLRPVQSIEEALNFKSMWTESILIGERHGKKCLGFDFGNSPSQIQMHNLKEKTVIHTTSAGTNGICNAINANEIITGSFVNAQAISRYILQTKPPEVSFVCMGNGGTRRTEEDELCADYIIKLLYNQKTEEIDNQIQQLQYNAGKHFFNPSTQQIYPEADYWMCIKQNIFNFVLRVDKDNYGLTIKKILI